MTLVSMEQDPQPKLDPDCDPQHADQGEGHQRRGKDALADPDQQVDGGGAGKKKLDGAGVLLLALGVGEKVDRHQRAANAEKPAGQAGNGRADHCGGNAVPDGKAPVGKHEVERQYDQEDAEDQDQHLQIQGGGQKDGKGAARDVDQQGEGQPPEGDTASKAEGQRIIQKQERCGGYGRGVQHIQKKGEDHHDDDPSAKADHGLDGPAQKGDRSDQHQVHTQHLPIVSHSRRRAAIAVIITEDNDLVKILSRNWSKTE